MRRENYAPTKRHIRGWMGQFMKGHFRYQCVSIKSFLHSRVIYVTVVFELIYETAIRKFSVFDTLKRCPYNDNNDIKGDVSVLLKYSNFIYFTLCITVVLWSVDIRVRILYGYWKSLLQAQYFSPVDRFKKVLLALWGKKKRKADRNKFHEEKVTLFRYFYIN